MNEILSFEGHLVRVEIVAGDPWWVASDVCDILGLGNVTAVLSRIDDDEKGFTSIKTLGGIQEIAVINESGLYSLIIGSRKPDAKKFKRWITHEVLPSIRKTGAYSVTTDEPDEFDVMHTLLDMLKADRQKIALLENNSATQEIHINVLDSQVATLDRRVDLFGADTHYRTVRAYCNQHKIKAPERRANAIGRKAAKMCRDRGVDIGLVADERHGQVNSYPVEIIAEAVNATEAK